MSPWERIAPLPFLQFILLPWSVAFAWSSKTSFVTSERWSSRMRSTHLELTEPDESSNFGRQQYWNECYRQSPASKSSAERNNMDSYGSGENEDECLFSWYCGWQDLEPFFTELVPNKTSRILVPGIGNDAAIRDMFDFGFKRMSAFDYAPEGVECARRMLGEGRLVKFKDGVNLDEKNEGVDLRVADARNLPYEDDSFDAVFEKGTLDAVYLSGGTDKDRARLHLTMAVSELARVVRRDGMVFSVTAACVDAIQDAFSQGTAWTQVRDGNLHITQEGYASNNVDATMLAWVKNGVNVEL